MKNAIKFGLAGALILAVGACNPAKFDNLKDDMWVVATEAPDGVDSNDFANGLVWGGQADGLKLFAIGNRPAWAELSFNAAGDLATSAVRVDTYLAGADVIDGVPSLAGDPDSVGGTNGTVGLGLTNAGAATIVLLDADTFGFTSNIALTNGGDLIDAMAFGPTSASAGSDIIAIRGRSANSDSRLTIITDYQAVTDAQFAQASCILSPEEGYAVAVGDVDSTLADSEIIIGMGARSRTSGQGQVVIVPGALVTTTAGLGDDLPCSDGGVLSGTIDAPNMEPDFGAALAVGDFDGDGANGGKGNDLAVSAPSANKVYVYFNLDVSAALPTPVEITPPPGVESYGATLAAGDFDGDGVDELVIGDPKADVDAVVNAGRADIVVFSGGQVADSFRLYDAQPESNQSFGRALTVATFNGSEILAIGAKDEVFTYFRTPVDGDTDSRQ